MACVIPARCFFFDECIDDETLGAYFDKKENKSIVSVFFVVLFCFFINILLGHCVFVVSWIDTIDDLFIVYLFTSFLN